MSDPLRPQGGFADLVGYRLQAWAEDYAELSLELAEKHLNRSGVMHGGIPATLLDAACGYAGCYSSDPQVDRRAFTLSLDCHFVASADAGARLVATARRTGGGGRIFFATGEVRDQDGRLVAQGVGVYRYRSTPPSG